MHGTSVQNVKVLSVSCTRKKFPKFFTECLNIILLLIIITLPAEHAKHGEQNLRQTGLSRGFDVSWQRIGFSRERVDPGDRQTHDDDG